jgi:hypothetical protein
MARDTSLVLDSGQTITVDANGTAVDTEGGYRADVRVFGGTFGAATDTLVIVIEVSVNGGSNYYSVGEFPLLDGADDDIEIARSCYIPQPDSGQTVTKVRVRYDVTSNDSPSFVIDKVFLEPLTSLSPPALDEELSIGLVKLV